MKDSPDVVLIVKGDGNLCVLGNGGNSIDTQVDHPISNHMTNLVKQSREKLTSPQVALLSFKREASFCEVALIYSMNNYPKFSIGKRPASLLLSHPVLFHLLPPAYPNYHSAAKEKP